MLDTDDGKEFYEVGETSYLPIQNRDKQGIPQDEYQFKIAMTRIPFPAIAEEFLSREEKIELKKSAQIFRSTFLTDILHDTVSLQDDQGSRIYTDTLGGGGWTHNYKYTVGHDSRWSKDGAAPARLIWRIPSEMRLVEIPFQLRNLPLPPRPASPQTETPKN